jgi:hypothetical protein
VWGRPTFISRAQQGTECSETLKPQGAATLDRGWRDPQGLRQEPPQGLTGKRYIPKQQFLEAPQLCPAFLSNLCPFNLF